MLTVAAPIDDFHGKTGACSPNDSEIGVGHEALEAALREEADVIPVEDPSPVVVESSDRDPYARVPVPEVRHADDQRSTGCKAGPHLLEDPLGRTDVLVAGTGVGVGTGPLPLAPPPPAPTMIRS